MEPTSLLIGAILFLSGGATGIGSTLFKTKKKADETEETIRRILTQLEAVENRATMYARKAEGAERKLCREKLRSEHLAEEIANSEAAQRAASLEVELEKTNQELNAAKKINSAIATRFQEFQTKYRIAKEKLAAAQNEAKAANQAADVATEKAAVIEARLESLGEYAGQLKKELETEKAITLEQKASITHLEELVDETKKGVKNLEQDNTRLNQELAVIGGLLKNAASNQPIPVETMLQKHFADEINAQTLIKLQQLSAILINPITQFPFKTSDHLVLGPDQQVYEKTTLQQWYDNGNRRCPLIPSIPLPNPSKLPRCLLLEQTVVALRSTVNTLQKEQHKAELPDLEEHAKSYPFEDLLYRGLSLWRQATRTSLIPSTNSNHEATQRTLTRSLSGVSTNA